MFFQLRLQGDDQEEDRWIPEDKPKKIITKKAVSTEGKATKAEENQQHNQVTISLSLGSC